MYSIQKKNYGYFLTFSGLVSPDEMNRWFEDCKKELVQSPDEFVVFVDMRELAPLEQEAMDTITQGQKMFKRHGMMRSVVVVEKPVVNLQFVKISKLSGIHDNERVLDLMTSPNWEEAGMNWILHGIEPSV